MSINYADVSNLAIFLGRPYTIFSDNAKYAFLYCLNHASDLNCCYLSFNEQEYDLLRSHDLPVLFFENPDCHSILENAKFVISDSVDWKYSQKKWDALKHAISINLWHGLPLKNIGLLQVKNQKNMPLQQVRSWSHACSNFDAVLSTSPFVTKAFTKYFHARNFPVTGYPRNDVLFRNATDRDLINVDQQLYTELKSLKSDDWKIIFYMPTFRDKAKIPFDAATLDFDRMQKFGEENKVMFVLKLHPILNVKVAGELPNVRFAENRSDAYPLLPFCDMLVTDYSSVYFDFLLLNRPILFYPYDLDYYINDDRGMIYDYDKMTPGQKVNSVDELYLALTHFISSTQDTYKSERYALRDLVFDHADGNSAERFSDFLKQEFLK